MPDGTTYMNLWAKSWRVVTNDACSIPKFRSVERWHLASYDSDGNVLVIVPGCQVKGFAACDANPSYKGGPQAYTVEKLEKK